MVQLHSTRRIGQRLTHFERHIIGQQCASKNGGGLGAPALYDHASRGAHYFRRTFVEDAPTGCRDLWRGDLLIHFREQHTQGRISGVDFEAFGGEQVGEPGARLCIR